MLIMILILKNMLYKNDGKDFYINMSRFVVFEFRIWWHPVWKRERIILLHIVNIPGRGLQDAISDGSLFDTMCNKDSSLSL